VNESFSEPTGDDVHGGGRVLVEGPQYTRPQNFRGWEVPGVLMSGNHGEIAKWRREQSEEKTRKNRPELLKRRD